MEQKLNPNSTYHKELKAANVRKNAVKIYEDAKATAVAIDARATAQAAPTSTAIPNFGRTNKPSNKNGCQFLPCHTDGKDDSSDDDANVGAEEITRQQVDCALSADTFSLYISLLDLHRCVIDTIHYRSDTD